MTCSNNAPDENRKLVLDTSVIINLHSSNFGKTIVEALPFGIVTTRIVMSELNSATGHSLGSYKFVCQIFNIEHASVAELNAGELSLTNELTSTAGEVSLDDGEASVIALSKLRNSERKFIPVIDEKKEQTEQRRLWRGKYRQIP